MATRSRSPEATRARADSADERRRRRVSAAVGHPAVFGELYVKPYDANWHTALPDVALQILAFCMSTRNGVIWTPPEFLKTTILSQLYPLWLTVRYAQLGLLGELAGMLVSEEKDLAERNLGVTSWHIENNERLRVDFVDTEGRPLLEPDPGEDKWKDDAIVVRRPGVMKDPTWQAKALRSAGVQGSRLKHLLGDDVVTPLTAHSPARQREARRLWDVQFSRRVLPEGQKLIAGNFNSSHDLLSELAGRNSYRVFKRPSLHVPGDPSKAPQDPRDPTAIEALPERWPLRRLLGELSASPSTFVPVHLLRSATEGGTELRVSWVQRIALSQVPYKNRIIIGLDPAPGADVDPDPSFFNLTVAALSAMHLDVLASIAVRIETTEQVDLLAKYVAAYAPVTAIAVAKIALDSYFSGAVLVGHPELRPLLHPVSIAEATATSTRPKIRLAALGSYAFSGWLRVVESAWSEQTSSADDRDHEETLHEQWSAYPEQNHDDRLDGLDVTVRAAMDFVGGQATVLAQQPASSERPTELPDTELGPGEVAKRVW